MFLVYNFLYYPLLIYTAAQARNVATQLQTPLTKFPPIRLIYEDILHSLCNNYVNYNESSASCLNLTARAIACNI